MKIIQIAAICHAINLAYCKSMGDNSQLPWEEAPEWQRESAIKGVEFHIENPGASPSASHESWLKEKEINGWKYGPVKDVEKKEHPCFVPYDQLPNEQKAKDYLFKQTVESLRHAFCGTRDKPTFGQKAVGISFNPSGDDEVFFAKQTCANAIDQMNDFRNNPNATNGQKRHASAAITELETAQMRMVKALTWKED